MGGGGEGATVVLAVWGTAIILAVWVGQQSYWLCGLDNSHTGCMGDNSHIDCVCVWEGGGGAVVLAVGWGDNSHIGCVWGATVILAVCGRLSDHLCGNTVILAV